ncbi:glycosyltransferase family 4 protein [Fonticella tunisiensis]|uniref:Glycosyl transferase family 1 n=1 Tax=Fonticella tunisiensis TaxID=1096341 RepID=A0A4R7KR03_9CLOT|nr:glycosyltransferase family 4 protein [Fonticella tunisiensis]TDT61033.1 glycosyl transferase family 1 [Fonticella tunisiensis]
MIDYQKLKEEYASKRMGELLSICNNRHPIYDLNTGLIDKDEGKINSSIKKLESMGYRHSFIKFEYLKEKKHLNIGYLLPHNLITGGYKILIEQANNLYTRGHNVVLYSHFPRPEWLDVKCRYFKVPSDRDLYEMVSGIDLIIAGYWDLIADVMKAEAPMKYYIAQGDIDIFEYDTLPDYFKNAVTTAHSLPVKILTVSKIMQKRLKELYGRESVLIPNAIDEGIFYAGKNRGNNPPEILLVGSDALKFKGHEDIIKALYHLKKEGYKFKVKWIIPVLPEKDFRGTGINIAYHVCPTQDEIGWLYRHSEIYISGSYYEAFSLPPLEAMACGTAVITTSNEGVKEYAVDNENCLMYQAGNVDQLIEKIKMLLKSRNLRKRLIEKGLETAKMYTWKNSIDLLEKEFMEYKDNMVIGAFEALDVLKGGGR